MWDGRLDSMYSLVVLTLQYRRETVVTGLLLAERNSIDLSPYEIEVRWHRCNVRC